MDNSELKSIIEGLLFTWGDPLELKDIAGVLDIKEKETELIIKELMDELDYNRRGLRIIKFNNSYQIGTRPEHYEWIGKLNLGKNKRNLSNAALETLSIIAYRQPIIKSDIEIIRGVRCDRAIETLIERNLVIDVGRRETTGRPILYGTTDLTRKNFNLANLPKEEEFIKRATEEIKSGNMGFFKKEVDLILGINKIVVKFDKTDVAKEIIIYVYDKSTLPTESTLIDLKSL